MGAMCSYEDEKIPKKAKNRRHFNGGYDTYDFHVTTDSLTKLSADILIIFVEDGQKITSSTEHFGSLGENAIDYLNNKITKDSQPYFHFRHNQEKGLDFNYIGVVQYDSEDKDEFEDRLRRFFATLGKLRLKSMVICDLPEELYHLPSKRSKVLLESIRKVRYDIPDRITIRAANWKSGNSIKKYLDENQVWG